MHPLIRVLGKSVVQAASAKIASEMAKPENQERLAAAAERLAEKARTVKPPDPAAVESTVYAGIRSLGRAVQNARNKGGDS